MELSERAETEIDALKAIFLDDFKLIDEDEHTKVWRPSWKKPSRTILLDLRPMETSSTIQVQQQMAFGKKMLKHMSTHVILEFRLPITYPEKAVMVEIKSAVGLSRDQTKELHKELLGKAKDLEGSEMIYELAIYAREFLTRVVNNASVHSPTGTIGGGGVGANKSLYDDMIQREIVNEKLQAKIALEEREKEKMVERERESLLKLKIEKELTRKKLRAHEQKEQIKKLMDDRSPPLIPNDTVDAAVIYDETKMDQRLFQKEQPPRTAVSSSFMTRYSYGPAISSASRYQTDFFELEFLGKGSYGEVVKAQNRLDGRLYAVKKLRLDPKDYEYNKRMIREVTMLSRLHHAFVVRYYQAWLEGSETVLSSGGEGTSTSMNNNNNNNNNNTEASDKEVSAESFEDDFLSVANDNTQESQFIQFEYSGEVNDMNKSDDKLAAHSSSDKDSSVKYGAKSWAEVAKMISNSSNDHNEDDDDNQNMRRVKEMGRQYGILFIQMEYCEKKTLKDAIRSGMDVKESWRLFRQILEGLCHIHQQGMVHRDLKPMNIFLDIKGDIKIGDFGLAINLDLTDKEVQSSKSTDYTRGSDMTTGVGTSLYMAPEILRRRFKYDQKVDMFSLGIILFECVYRFHTEMERVNVLRNLRTAEIIFPQDFKHKELDKHEHVIKWLLQHDPEKRPTSNELLDSEYLPSRMEDEAINETLRTISRPDTPYYSRLMSSLFSQHVDPSKDFTYDFNSGQYFDELKSVIFSKVKDVVTGIFKRHGAIEFSTPLLIPKFSLQDLKPGVVRLLDTDGTVVELPYDLTVPFARWIARSDTRYLKRWSFDKVFRQNMSGGQPRLVYEADFDIIHTIPSNMAYEAEVLRSVTEILDELPGLKSRGYFIRVNNASIVDEVFDKLRIPREKRFQLCLILNNCNTRLTWAQISKQLKSQLGISSASIDSLEAFTHISGTIDDSEKKLSVLLGSGTTVLHQTFADLKTLEMLVRRSGTTCSIMFHFLTVFNYQYYQGGTMFQVLLQGNRPEIVAAGGRYDRLLAIYRHPSSKNANIFGVGVNIAIAKIALNIEYAYHGANHVGTVVDEARLWVPRSCEMLVASFGKVPLAERLAVCHDLWNANFSADYVIEDGKYSIEELLSLCRTRHITWLIILKDHPRDSARRHNHQPMIKIKNISSLYQKELDVKKEEMIDVLLGQIKEYTKVNAEKAGLTKMPRRERTISMPVNVADEAQGMHESDYNVVIVSNPRFSSKMKVSKKHLIEEKAIKAVAAFVEQLTGSQSKATVEIVAVDLRVPALKKIASCENIFNDDLFKKDVLDALQPVRDYLLVIRSSIADLKRNLGTTLKFLFLYSYTEDSWELLKLN